MAGCTFSFTPPIVTIDASGTSDFGGQSPPKLVTLNTSIECSWTWVNNGNAHPGQFWSTNGLGIVGAGPQSFTVSFEPNYEIFPRMDEILFQPLDLSLPQFSVALIQGPVYQSYPSRTPGEPWPPPYVFPWPSVPRVPKRFGDIVAEQPDAADVSQIKVARNIYAAASQLDDADARKVIQEAAQNAMTSAWRKLKEHR